MSESTNANDMCSASVYGPTGCVRVEASNAIRRRTMLDSAGGRKEGNRDTLPKRQEQDALDTKEFG
jgi:hypothetical protein